MFTHAFKRLIAKTSVAAVLFTQLAVAAYACPAIAGPANMISPAIADGMPAAMPGCGMPDTDTANLCVQHCQTGNQSAQTLSEVSIPAFAAISALAVIEPVPVKSNFGVAVLSVLPGHATSPPPLLRFGVLRI